MADAPGAEPEASENPLSGDVESADVAPTDAALKKTDGDQAKMMGIVAQLSTTPTNWRAPSQPLCAATGSTSARPQAPSHRVLPDLDRPGGRRDAQAGAAPVWLGPAHGARAGVHCLRHAAQCHLPVVWHERPLFAVHNILPDITIQDSGAVPRMWGGCAACAVLFRHSYAKPRANGGRQAV